MFIKKEKSRMFGTRYFTKTNDSDFTKQLDAKWMDKKPLDMTLAEFDESSKDAKLFAKETGGISATNLLLIGIYGGAAAIYGVATGVMAVADKLQKHADKLKIPVYIKKEVTNYPDKNWFVTSKNALARFEDERGWLYSISLNENRKWYNSYQEAIDGDAAEKKAQKAFKGRNKK